MSITFLLCGARAARRAAETPTGPAPMTARSNGLSETSSRGVAAWSGEIDDDERCLWMIDDDGECGWNA